MNTIINKYQEYQKQNLDSELRAFVCFRILLDSNWNTLKEYEFCLEQFIVRIITCGCNRKDFYHINKSQEYRAFVDKFKYECIEIMGEDLFYNSNYEFIAYFCFEKIVMEIKDFIGLELPQEIESEKVLTK